MAFTDDVKKYVDKGIAASRNALTKASDAMSKFGDQSVKKVEKLQLESKLKQQYASLGEQVFLAFTADGKESVSKTEEFVSAMIEKIETTKNEIVLREAALAKE